MTLTKENRDMLIKLAWNCHNAILEGRSFIVVSRTGPKRLPGFPRGQLLSVGTDGSRNYAVCPLKVLAWIHSGTKAARELEEGTET